MAKKEDQDFQWTVLSQLFVLSLMAITTVVTVYFAFRSQGQFAPHNGVYSRDTFVLLGFGNIVYAWFVAIVAAYWEDASASKSGGGPRRNYVSRGHGKSCDTMR